MKVKVFDNFLPADKAKTIEDVCVDDLIWTFHKQKVYNDKRKPDDLSDYQFTHMFYFRDKSKFYNLTIPIMDEVNKISTSGAIRRIKANLEPYNSERRYSEFHTDYDHNPNMNVGIYYVNTCDGYTEFEDGDKIESVQNRFIWFPNTEKHRGVSQTNSKYRIVINFNWFS